VASIAYNGYRVREDDVTTKATKDAGEPL